jgi:branched-chain amino acid transport system ATP-binding protein
MSELITTQHLTKSFGGLIAVNEVDFHVEKGQVAGLIGPNGSGKTTLFNLLTGYSPPTSGTITFEGEDLTNTPSHKRVSLGMVRTFQLVSVFDSLSVWENLVLSGLRFKKNERSIGRFYLRTTRRPAILENCSGTLAIVGLEKKANLLTAELSYGDKRMLEIAIALSLKPKLLLLDEPLSGLSDHEIREVIDLLHRVKQELTLVIIDHKISKIVDLVDRLSVMNYGRIICEGDPDQVLCDPTVRECYWGKENQNCSM